MKRIAAFTIALAALGLQSPAAANEVWLGATAHAVDTPFSLETLEGGADIQGGWRGAPIDGLGAIGKPSPYVVASISLNGETGFAAAGLSWKFGDAIYVRPGIGLAVHDGKIPRSNGNGRRVDLGSRILFEPEIAVGARISERLSAEASWVHISNARIFSEQNAGMDFIGARLVLQLK